MAQGGVVAGSGIDRRVFAHVQLRYRDTGAGWYERGVAWAKEHGLSDGTNPEGGIKREQLVTMLWRYAGSPEAADLSGRFTDADSISDWATDAMDWAVDNGILTGLPDGSVNPGGSATRAELAVVLMRFVTYNAAG